MLNKKGFAEQYNWIFIIIAGAIILGFFTMFAFRYVNLENAKQDLASIRDFGNALNTLEKLSVGDSGTTIDSNKPDEGLRFGYKLKLGHQCMENKSDIFINGGEYANYELKDEIVFMEDEQNVKALDMWLLPWRFPFHVTNIIFLSDPLKTYYLVYDDTENKNFLDELKLDEIKNTFNFEIINIKDLKIKDNSKIIFFTKKIPNADGMERFKQTYGKVDFTYVNKNKDEVSFYEKKWSAPVKYYGKELLFGAIFSNNQESYSCEVSRALNKLKDTSNIYIERINILKQVNKNKDCNYDSIADLLRKLMAGDYKVKENLASQNKGGSDCLWVF